MRFLVILVAIALAVLAIRRLWRSSRPTGGRPGQPAHMVQCARCGIYVPEHEALRHDGRCYCSQDHLEEDRDAAD